MIQGYFTYFYLLPDLKVIFNLITIIIYRPLIRMTCHTNRYKIDKRLHKYQFSQFYQGKIFSTLIFIYLFDFIIVITIKTQ